MNTSDEKNSTAEPEEERFVQRALAKVEKAERFQLIKQIVVTVIVFPAVYYIMGNEPARRAPFSVIMVIGLMLALITTKIMWLNNKNTTAILRAIAAIEAQMRIQSGWQAMAQTTENSQRSNRGDDKGPIL
jgi:protein-S-isoprenylcysteine O-methyltransferase Ste14